MTTHTFSFDDDFMDHLSQMEQKNEEMNAKNADSLPAFLEKATVDIQSSESFSPLERMGVVDTLEELSEQTDFAYYGKTGIVIKIITDKALKDSHRLNYEALAQKQLSLVFRAANQLFHYPAKQTHIDFLFIQDVEDLSLSTIFDHIEENIDNKEFSSLFFQFLKKQTPTKYVRSEKHNHREELRIEMETTPTYELDALNDNQTACCTPIDTLGEKEARVEISNDFVSKIMHRAINLFQQQIRFNQVAPAPHF